MTLDKQLISVVIFTGILITGCGDDKTDMAGEESGATQAPGAVSESMTTTPADAAPVAPASEPAAQAPAAAPLDNGVIYQDEIYKDWPYTEAPPASAQQTSPATTVDEAVGMIETVKQEVTQQVEAVSQEAGDMVAAAMPAAATPAANDKPYQLVDGGISANAIEGWKTYNGGGCGACHGKGGIGAVGPNLADSVTQNLSKSEFVDIVTNGRPGTMMRPHKTNKRVMDNLDDLYAYLVARGDGVLGPENLIKSPLGK